MTAPAAQDRSRRVAVVGSGPSGLYAAEALVRQEDVPVTVDVLDRLPTPYGLVRYGVAPDHLKIKSIVGVLQRVFEHPGVRFLGGVDFGVSVTRADLRRHYDAVVYATGASVDRRLGIPGEDLPGSHAATDFVTWYSGHPDAAQPFELAARSVAVIGAGNVAVDVTRVLAKSADDLRHTDVPLEVLAALRRSQVREISIVARRGPSQAKYTTKELRELGELANADVVVDPAEVSLGGEPDPGRAARANVDVLTRWAAGPPAGGKPRRIALRFWLRPVEILGTERVEAVRLERTELDSAGRLRGTGRFRTIPAQLVLRAVGYRSVPLPGVPFDHERGLVPNSDGRVVGADGAVVAGEYVTGWLKRGPTGVIGTNKGDAAQTVRAVLDDFRAAGASAPVAAAPIDDVLRDRGVTPVSYAGWLAIDAAEIAGGSSAGRARQKIVDWKTLHAHAAAGSAEHR